MVLPVELNLTTSRHGRDTDLVNDTPTNLLSAAPRDMEQARAHVRSASAAARLHDWALALEEAEAACDVMPSWPIGWARRGGILAELGRNTEARTALVRACA